MKFEAKIQVFPDYSLHYFEVPPRVVKALGGKFRLRLLCVLNGKHRFQCGLMALGGGKGYVMVSRARLKAIGCQRGDRVKVSLERDTSKYGIAVPPEFREVLKQDPEGARRFAKLKPGKQRTLLHHVASSRNVDSRIERALQVIENLKRLPLGKETIPALLGRNPSPGSGRW